MYSPIPGYALPFSQQFDHLVPPWILAGPCCWNHSITAIKVSFENIHFRVPSQTSNCHSSKGLVPRHTSKSQSILVKNVDASLFSIAWLRRIRVQDPFVSRKVPERGMRVGEVYRRTIEVLTLVDIFTFAVWGRRNEPENIGWLVAIRPKNLHGSPPNPIWQTQ